MYASRVPTCTYRMLFHVPHTPRVLVLRYYFSDADLRSSPALRHHISRLLSSSPVGQMFPLPSPQVSLSTRVRWRQVRQRVTDGLQRIETCSTSVSVAHRMAERGASWRLQTLHARQLAPGACFPVYGAAGSRPNRCSLAAARCGLQQRHALLVGTIVLPGSSKVDDGWMEEGASQASTPIIDLLLAWRC